MIKIADLEFGIEYAQLDAFIDDDDMTLQWGVEVQGLPGNGEFVRWRPKLTDEVFLVTRPGDLKNWRDLAGRKVSWSTPYDGEDEPYAVLYILEHEPIYKCTLEVIGSDSGRLSLRLSAKTDVNWNPQYSQGLDLRIETELDFKGIWCGERPEQVCRQRLSAFFPPDDFEFKQTKHGVSLMCARV